MRAPTEIIRQGKEQEKIYGSRGVAWAFGSLSKAERDALDAWLVTTKHPLAFEPGTQEGRFRSLIRNPAPRPDSHLTAAERLAARWARSERPAQRRRRIARRKVDAARVAAIRRAWPNAIGAIPGRALEIRYRRTGPDGGDYVHKFSARSGVRMHARPDGAVLLKGRRRIWADDRESGFSRYTRRNPMRRRHQSSGGGSMFVLGLGLLALWYFTQPRSVQLPNYDPASGAILN